VIRGIARTTRRTRGRAAGRSVARGERSCGAFGESRAGEGGGALGWLAVGGGIVGGRKTRRAQIIVLMA
jgi:hypothetical protein